MDGARTRKGGGGKWKKIVNRRDARDDDVCEK